MTRIVNIVVDNRVLVLGLDKFYRDAMKRFEVATLLPCAQAVAADLQVSAKEVPVEGYYHETPELQRYFKLMRALQRVPAGRANKIQKQSEFRILKSVCSSPVFGESFQGDNLLPIGKDPVTQSMESMSPEKWTIPNIVEGTYRIVTGSNDISLVGLAGRCRDAVPLCALRESTVLYVWAALAIPEETQYHYEWCVTAELQNAAEEFRRIFTELVPNDIPEILPANADSFHSAYTDNDICGRCVRLGDDPRARPRKYYHWAIGLKNEWYEVEEFWSEELWTTERYQMAQRGLRSEKRGGLRGWWSNLWGK